MDSASESDETARGPQGAGRGDGRGCRVGTCLEQHDVVRGRNMGHSPADGGEGLAGAQSVAEYIRPLRREEPGVSAANRMPRAVGIHRPVVHLVVEQLIFLMIRHDV